MFDPIAFVSGIFGFLLDLLYRGLTNYGIAIAVFSVMFNLFLHFLRQYNTVNSVKKARLRPKIVAIREKFPKRTDIQTKIMEELYDKEGVSPGWGIITSIVPFIILVIMFSVINQPVQFMLGVDKETSIEIFKLLNEADPSLFPKGTYNELIIAQNIPAYAEQIKAAFPEISKRVLEGVRFEFLGLDLAQVPNLDASSWEAMDWQHIGLAAMPILAIIAHIFPSLISSFKKAFLKKGSNASEAKKNFDFVSPMLLIIFVMACFRVTAAISLYWIVQSIMSEISQLLIRRKLMNLPPEVTDLDELMAPYLATTEKEADTSVSNT